MDSGSRTQDTRPPRGALIVIAVGLIACVVAALAAVGKGEGEAAQLEWVMKSPMPDSQPVAVPGGGQQMRLTDGGIRATGLNVSGYELFRVLTTLRIDAGAPIGRARILCSVKAPGAEVGQTSGGLRASYPRSSEENLYAQEVPEVSPVEFSSHGAEIAAVEIDDLPDRFATIRKIKLSWPRYEKGIERWEYFLPSGRPGKELALPFLAVWKTTSPPKAEASCTLTTAAGKATVSQRGSLPRLSPPIAE
ncbi:MAG TPA: hypothetical protein VFJ99_02400 [Solirubrobacterales bacterium]|nr:hypothetical protein [Solirubrobacterales bacterium]